MHPQKTLGDLRVVLVQSPVGLLLLSSGSWCGEDLFVPSKTGVSVSSILMEVLKLNPAGLQGQIPWEFLVPLSDPQAGNPDVGLRTSTSGRTLWYYCSPVSGVPT